nr:hypothetical protein [Tanacetum cinerariifolium]
ASHELVQQGGRLASKRPAGGQRPRKAEAGQVGGHHVEGIFSPAAVRGGVGEQRNELGELPRRVGPAVVEQQRPGPGAAPALVDETQAGAAERRLKPGQLVELRLLLPPVKVVLPVRQQLAQVGGAGTLLPAGSGGGGGPAGVGQPGAQVVERGLRNGYFKGLHEGRDRG